MVAMKEINWLQHGWLYTSLPSHLDLRLLSIQAHVIHLLVPSGVPAFKVISDPEVCTICIPKIFVLLSRQIMPLSQSF